MKRVNEILGASGLVLALALGAAGLVLSVPVPSAAQTRTLPTQTITISGIVETIDKDKRAVNIKTADGKFVAVDVPESVKGFDQLKIGDKVSATYNNTVSARLKQPGEADVNAGGTASTMGQEARPGGTAVGVRTMTATITDVDKNASSITFTGPNGWKYSRRVVEPDILDKVKVGDKVDITWNTDVTVAVQ